MEWERTYFMSKDRISWLNRKCTKFGQTWMNGDLSLNIRRTTAIYNWKILSKQNFQKLRQSMEN